MKLFEHNFTLPEITTLLFILVVIVLAVVISILSSVTRDVKAIKPLFYIFLLAVVGAVSSLFMILHESNTAIKLQQEKNKEIQKRLNNINKANTNIIHKTSSLEKRERNMEQNWLNDYDFQSQNQD